MTSSPALNSRSVLVALVAGGAETLALAIRIQLSTNTSATEQLSLASVELHAVVRHMATRPAVNVEFRTRMYSSGIHKSRTDLKAF